MARYNHFSHLKAVFHDFPALEEGSSLAGYAALIEAHDLQVPLPDFLCTIGKKHKKFLHERWRFFTPRHKPDDTLLGHLTFALKYEGVDLAILNSLFQERYCIFSMISQVMNANNRQDSNMRPTDLKPIEPGC